MKWYFALNEAGTAGGLGLHGKLAVLSARAHTSLRPHLLYFGARNDYTRWMEAEGVTVIDCLPPCAALIDRLVAEGRYSHAFDGHWLRLIIPLIDRESAFALYTDADVVFLDEPPVADLRPDWFAAAPEFRPDAWNYVNTGVVVMNLPALRADYPAFETWLAENLAARVPGFHDQQAYNEFYRRRWQRLDPSCNWKPYWGAADAPVLHFHGPKIDVVRAIVDGGWDWSGDHGRQIGSLLGAHTGAYAHYLRRVAACPGLPAAAARALTALARDVEAWTPPRERIDLAFTGFRMFGED